MTILSHLLELTKKCKKIWYLEMVNYMKEFILDGNK